MIAAASPAARVGGYFEYLVARAGGTALDQGIARVTGQLVGLGDTGEGVYLSGASIARICYERGVTTRAPNGNARPPSSGAVSGVLESLRATLALSWEKAYSTRWHEEIPPDAIRAEYQGEERGFRFPPRRLCLASAALQLLDGAKALGARVIDAARRAAPNAGPVVEAGTPRVLVPRRASRESVPAELPITRAVGADPAAPESPPAESSYFARVARAYLDAQRDRR